MDTHETTEYQEHADKPNRWAYSKQVLAECTDIETAFAETLLDQVEEAQLQVRALSNDIGLLQAAENALDLVAENLSKIRRLTLLKQQGSLNRHDEAEVNDRINNLMMVTMLVAEDAEYNGRRLFRDDVIELNSIGNGRLFLATSRLPEIRGIETNDCRAVLECLNAAAQVINRQYRRTGDTLRNLLSEYHQLQKEINLLITEQARHKG